MTLAARSGEPELMDAADLDSAVYQRCLADLAAVNRLTLTHRATLQFLQNATKDWPVGRRIVVLDLAFGQGDLLRAIAAWAARRGFTAVVSGVDLNPRSAIAAQAATPPAQNIAYHTADAFAFTPAQPPDFIVTSQFTHHLSDDQIVRLLRWMDATATQAWHIADLHRHIFPYYGFRLLCRLMGWHPIVRHDGTVSIARSFRRADWDRYLAQAGINAKITWHMLFRFCVGRIK